MLLVWAKKIESSNGTNEDEWSFDLRSYKPVSDVAPPHETAIRLA